MTKTEQVEFRNKVMKGLKLSYKRLLQQKRERKYELLIMKDHKIQRIKLGN